MAGLLLPGTAGPAQVLSGYTASGAGGLGFAGTAVAGPEWGYASDTTVRYYLAAAYDSTANLTYAIDGYNGSNNLSTVTAYSH